MSYQAKVLNVLIASPGDVPDERELLAKAVSEWTGLNSEALGVVLSPKLYELDATPEAGDRLQAIINRQLVDKADILVGVFWTRLGTPTGVAPSGTVEEIENIVGRNKPVLLYFSSRPKNPDEIDHKQHRLLKKFRKDFSRRAVTGNYAELHELKEKILRDLTRTVRQLKEESEAESPSSGATSPNTPSSPSVTGKAGTHATGTRRARSGGARSRAHDDAPRLPPAGVTTDEISPPREMAAPIDLATLSAKNLTSLADAILNEIAQEEQREWPRIRWKTLYTIDLRRRLRHGHDIPDFVRDSWMHALRTAGTALEDQLVAGNPQAVRLFREAGSFDGALEPAWFVNLLASRLGDDGPDDQPWSAEQEGIRSITRGELARVLFCETLVHALIRFGQVARGTRRAHLIRIFDGDLEPISRVVRELLVYNRLRQIDSMRVAPLPNASALDAANILAFLWPEDRRCAAILDYHVRWSNRMEVVVLTDDSARARFGGLGPFASKPWYDAPYAAFARAGRARGLDIVIAHYDDLDLTQRRVDAWGLLQGGKWESRLIYSEFFYDKFPTDVNTTPLRDRIKSDPRIQIWNRIVFTDLLADKFELSRLLDGSGVPAVSPTRRLELNAGRDAREALLVELEQETRQDGLVPAGEGRWIVVKPLTGWGGQGVDRMTTADFLDRDFHVAPYDRFGALVVQPFFESEVDVAELDIKGRHDVRVVFVGSTPVFGMIRELSPGLDVCAASLENIRRYGGRRRYIEVQELLRRPDAAALVNRVPVALGGLLGATPAIYSVDFCWVRAGGRLMPIVIELNSKPSQIWEEHDEDGRRVILKFHDAIVRQLAAFHDERVAPRS